MSAGPESCIGKCPKHYPNDDVWLLPHRDCTKYCSCVHGRPIEMPCPGDLHFSPKDHVCASPYEAECTGYDPHDEESAVAYLAGFNNPKKLANRAADSECRGQCPEKDDPNRSSTLAHVDCTKFCRCEGGHGFTQDCPAHLHFNLSYGGCTYPREARCEGRNGWTTVRDGPEDLCPCSTEVPVPTTPHDVSTTESTPFPSAFGCFGQCPSSDPWKVIHLAHEECSKYCKCYAGKAYVMPCPDNQHWNARSETCDVPSSARCTGIGGWVPNGDGNNNDYPPVPPTRPTPPPVANPQGCIGRCPRADPVDAVHLAHKDCTKFCKCSFGLAYVMDCPKNLHFNPKLQVCDNPATAQCTGFDGGWYPTEHTSARPTPRPTPSEQPPTRPPPPTPTPPSGSALGCIHDCPNFEWAVELVAHQDCWKYCECYRGVAHVLLCPGNQHYNPFSNSCEHPSQAQCTGNGGHYPEPTISSRPTLPPTAPSRPTPPTGTLKGCIGQCPKVDPVNVVHLVHENCWQFCKCQRGVPHLMDCPANLHFNPTLYVCDRKEDAKCTGNGAWWALN